jgi:hypothetical protein
MKELINKESDILEEVNSANFLHSESELLSDTEEQELVSDNIESDKEEI